MDVVSCVPLTIAIAPSTQHRIANSSTTIPATMTINIASSTEWSRILRTHAVVIADCKS
jgi:hypothetical protein